MMSSVSLLLLDLNRSCVRNCYCCCCCLQADKVLFVRCSNGDVHAITMKSGDTIAALKAKLHDSLGVFPTAQRLTYCGALLKQPDDAASLQIMPAGATIDLRALYGTLAVIQPATVVFVSKSNNCDRIVVFFATCTLCCCSLTWQLL